MMLRIKYARGCRLQILKQNKQINNTLNRFLQMIHIWMKIKHMKLIKKPHKSLRKLKHNYYWNHTLKNVNRSLWNRELFILDNGKESKEMDGENNYGLINHYMRENGWMIEHVGKEN
jgi:hypothetical protein